MSVLSFVTDIFSPVKDLVDELHTSGEEKSAHVEVMEKLNAAIREAEMQFQEKVLSAHTEQIKARAAVIEAEASGHSWLQRNWRPIIMLSFGAILVNNYILVPWLMALGIEAVAVLDFPSGFWGLLSLGVGGYIAGRSVEKTIEKWRPSARPDLSKEGDES